MSVIDLEFEVAFREAALAYLRSVQLATGGPVRNAEVADFHFDDKRARLMDTNRGIRKPKMLSAALSIRTVFAQHPDQRPYADDKGEDGYYRYKWRGRDGSHSENVALRMAMQHQLPLIWFVGFKQGLYLPIFPVWLIAEEPDQHQFVVALEQAQAELWTSLAPPELVRQRGYVERITLQRLDQPLFRTRVLSAYDSQCAICRLNHIVLLDAAHIRPDSEGGSSVVPNGLSLCKIHHAAYDADILGIDPDCRVRIRPSVMQESDGPTLRHTLQEMNGQKLHLPRSKRARPERELLAERFSRFESAST